MSAAIARTNFIPSRMTAVLGSCALLVLLAGCERRGACCFENEECLANATEQFCTGGGGTYRGDGSACAPDVCRMQIPGACCGESGACDLQGTDNCAAQGGVFQGENTSCEPNPCGGACCSDELCDITTEENCVGAFKAGLSCTPNPCAGACCIDGGICQPETTQEQCEGLGRYLGDGTGCEPNMCVGACCGPDGQCIVIDETDCDGEFAGPGTSCEPNPCTGACCDEQGACTVTTEDACSGTYEGGGTVCDASVCIGACCASSAACSLETLANCDAIQGEHQGIGTACEPNPCGGACCSDRLCDVTTEEDCLGEFRAGLSCMPNICVGACCRTDGTCEDEVLEEDCDGEYLGDGTDCMSSECLGACCKEDECSLLTSEDCERIEGEYQGNATTCDPNPCVSAVCCFGTECVDNTMDEMYCIDGGGVPISGASCADSPNPCLEVTSP